MSSSDPLPSPPTEKAELLLFAIDKGARVGGEYQLLGTATNLPEAIEALRLLPASGPSKVAVLRREAVLLRRPSIEVTETADTVLLPPEPPPIS